MPAPLTRTLGAFASGLRFDAIPAAALEAVRIGYTDSIAAMFGCLFSPVNRLTLDSLGPRGAAGEARIYLGAERASAHDAILANAVAIASEDFDDIALRGSHPSSILVPAIVGECEALGLGGKDAMCAYVVGYEVWARLVEREPDQLLKKGWHQTPVIGTVAAAAAVANLRRLDPAKATSAIAIACSFTGGLAANFGSLARPYQVGRAAAAGAQAARLAQAGMTGNPTAIESANGFLFSISPAGRMDLDTPLDDLGSAWRIQTVGLNVKKYPMGLATHRAIDGATGLIEAHGVTLADVADVTLFIGPAQAENRRLMQTSSGGAFRAFSSVEFGVAAMLVAGRIGFAELEPAFVDRADVRDAMKLVRTEIDDAIAPDTEPNLGYSGHVRIRLKDGRSFESADFARAKGHWTRKLDAAEHWKKFTSCCTPHLGEAAARALFDDLQQLERVGSLRDLNRPA